MSMRGLRIPAASLHVALYNRLAAWMTSLTFYTSPPTNSDFPYGFIGEFTAVEDSVKTMDLTNCTVAVHVYVKEQSVVAINSHINEVIKGVFYSKLDLSDDYEQSRVDLEMCETIPEIHPEGIVQHGIVRFRFLIADNQSIS